MRPEIPSVLKKIRDLGLTIGCISNTQSTTQVPNTLEKYGINEFFEHVVLSSSYGRRKPDPAIFYYAARLAKLPTRACMYVGDKINRDVLGSKAAGYCLSVKIQHPYDNGEVDEGAIPDAIIDNMTALIPIIENELEHKKSFSSVPMTSEIKALFFDAGDVLYYRPRKNEHLKAFLKSKKLSPASNIKEEKQRLKNLAFMGQIKRHDYYSQIIRLYGIKNQRDIEAGIQAIEEDDNTIEIYDGVPETIMELKKRGYLLGIITDTAMPFSKKLKWFHDYGFGDVWDVMISSRDIGLRKPEPIMYELAIQQTCIEPSEAIFVGHKKSELEGAKCVGMKTIAINYDEDAPADYYINCFSELLNLSCIQKK
jgi:HAD superfamily hydrolase (TIGR01509 family)